MNVISQYQPKKLVPIRLRYIIYEQALDHPFTKYGLCIALPMILWGMNVAIDEVNGEDWEYHDTILMFPEIKPWLNEVDKKEMSTAVISEKRLDFLRMIIAERKKQKSLAVSK